MVDDTRITITVNESGEDIVTSLDIEYDEDEGPNELGYILFKRIEMLLERMSRAISGALDADGFDDDDIVH